MKEFFSRIWSFLNNPKGWFLAIAYFLTAVFSAGAITLAVVAEEGSALSAVAYVFYFLAATSLTYSVYTAVKFAPKIKDRALGFINEFAFGRRILSHYGFRTIAFAAAALVVNIAYVAFHVVLAITMRSYWYGSLALYYGLLVAIRGVIVSYHRKKDKTGATEDFKKAELKKYRACGIMLTVIPLCLVVPILQIIFLDKAFLHEGWTVFAFAAYAFYKITMAIINVFKANRQQDVTVQAIRNVGLADATVSIFSLQTSLLYTFGEGADYAVYNVITGVAVCALTSALGVYMLIKANGKIKLCDENR